MYLATFATSVLFLTNLVAASFFNDIIKGLLGSGRYPHLLDSISDNTIQNLEQDAQQAGQFVCQILEGQFPAAFQDIKSIIIGEVSSDFDDFTSLIVALPTLAPTILNDIEQGGEDVVSAVEELATNPGAALTLIVGDVETVVDEVWAGIVTVAGAVETDAEHLGGEIKTFLGCLFGDCPASASASASAISDPALLALAQSCGQLLASPTAAITSAISTTGTLTQIFTSPPTATGSAQATGSAKGTASGEGYRMVLFLWMLPLGVVSGVMLLL